MSLDEDMRAKLRASAIAEERERESLSAEARARIIAATARHGVEIARRRRIVRIASFSTASVLAAAAASFFYWQAQHPGAPTALVPAHPAVAPACASDSFAAVPRTPLAPEVRVDLATRARFVTHAATLAQYLAPSSCDAAVELETGTVDVWARDLRSGELVVHAGDVDVIVHGTVFRVSLGADATRVSVDEGRVEVRSPGTPPVFVLAGETVALVRSNATGTATAARTAFGESDRASLHAITLALEPHVAQAAPLTPTVLEGTTRIEEHAALDSNDAHGVNDSNRSNRASDVPEDARSIDALLLDAERAYREGRVVEARRLFRLAGSARGPDAEVAWLRLGRLELRAGNEDEAVAALSEHRRRFPHGRLAAEALYLEATAEHARGHDDEARALEARLLREFPASPQARRQREND